jgi:hypothetical protein
VHVGDRFEMASIAFIAKGVPSFSKASIISMALSNLKHLKSGLMKH